MDIKFSNHAKERMILRGISVNDVKDALTRGSKGIQKPDKIFSHYKYFCVVYKKIDETYYIITVKPR